MAGNFHNPLPKYYSASRELRNQAEKQRRDKLNYHVTELASLVPFVTRAQKKVDKTSVLRLAASYIRMHKILRKTESDSAKSMPVALLNSDTSRSLLNSIGGFLLVITSAGKVIYASEAIEDTFGYSQADVLGQSFYSLVHQDDEHLIEQQLCPQESVRRSFYCRMLEKSISRSDPRRYEIIHVVGQFKPLPNTEISPKEEVEVKPLIGARLRRRTRSEVFTSDISDDEDGSFSASPSTSSESSHDMDSSHDRTGSHMLVAFVQVVHDKPITELSWVESMRDEYITRHRLDGNIAYVDHRISFVTGLMPEEVLGSSAFQYMHPDDILWSIIAQKQMLGSSQGHGMVTYRLICKDGSFVSLRSRGFLEVNKDTGKVDTFVCINTMLRENDAEDEVRTQRKQLLPLVSGQSHEDLAYCIGKDLPPDLSALVKGIISRQTINKMLNSVEDVSLSKIERGATLGYPVLPKKTIPDMNSSEGCKSKQQSNSRRGSKDITKDSQASTSDCTAKSLRRRSKKIHSVNERRNSRESSQFLASSIQCSTMIRSKKNADSSCSSKGVDDQISSICMVSQTVIGGIPPDIFHEKLLINDPSSTFVPPSNYNGTEPSTSASNFYNYESNSPTEWTMIDSLSSELESNMEDLYSPATELQSEKFLISEIDQEPIDSFLEPSGSDSLLNPVGIEANPLLPSNAMEVSTDSYSPFPQLCVNEVTEISPDYSRLPSDLNLPVENHEHFKNHDYSFLTITSQAETQPGSESLNYSFISKKHKPLGFISEI